MGSGADLALYADFRNNLDLNCSDDEDEMEETDDDSSDAETSDSSERYTYKCLAVF